jgi:cytidine deaminase
MEYKELVEAALDARKMAYTPYSHFKVGAALITKSGKLYKGCNIENAAYSPGNCAERTAIFKAVSEGEKEFSAIAIVGGPENKDELPICPPCGVCRQVINEFADANEFEVILGTNKSEEFKVFKLKELLPLGFGPKNLAE